MRLLCGEENSKTHKTSRKLQRTSAERGVLSLSRTDKGRNEKE